MHLLGYIRERYQSVIPSRWMTHDLKQIRKRLKEYRKDQKLIQFLEKYISESVGFKNNSWTEDTTRV